MITLRDTTKFAVSQNINLQLVKPLFESGNFQSQSALKKLLQNDLHKAFWRKDGPQAFDNALAGKFQEVLNAHRQALVKGKQASLGTVNKIGGDSVTRAVGQDGPENVKTAQFKTVAAQDIRGVHENIQKAAWQLCGHGGETPEKGSKKVIEVVLYQTREYTAYTPAQWAHEISDALSEGYSQNGKRANGPELFANVDLVKITTPTSRMTFQVFAGQNRVEVRDGQKGLKTTPKNGFIFDAAKLNQHWDWLRGTWWPQNITPLPDRDTMIKVTASKGVGAPGAFPKLPFQAS